MSVSNKRTDKISSDADAGLKTLPGNRVSDRIEEADYVGKTFRARLIHKIRTNWYYFSRSIPAVIGLVIVILVIMTAILAPWIAPHPDHAGVYVGFDKMNLPPCTEYLFGTAVLYRRCQGFRNRQGCHGR